MLTKQVIGTLKKTRTQGLHPVVVKHAMNTMAIKRAQKPQAVGDEQPKTGPRKFTFPAAGRAGLAVADRQLKPRARTIKGKPSSTGIGG